MNQLSSKLKPFQYIVAAFCLIFIAGLIRGFIVFTGPFDWQGFITISILILVGFLLIYLVRKLKDIKYDETSISISYRNNMEIIPMENILMVKMTMAEMADVNFYKIVYSSSTGNTKSVRFLPTDNFGDFLYLLKEKNKDVELINWASNFDF